MALEYEWIFAPLAGFALLLVVAVLAFGYIKRREATGTPLANTARLRRTAAYRQAIGRRRLFLILASLALILGLSSSAFASSRPVVTSIDNPVKYTRDIVLCLDVSGSMIETDILIIQKFKELIRQFNGERVSMVIFNSVSTQVFPLTDDYEYIDEQLDYVFNGFFVNPNNPGLDFMKYTLNDKGASLIGDGITACTMSFAFDDPDRSRSIILATDNVPNGIPIVELEDAVGLAKNRGVKIYAINPGSVEWETQRPLPEQEKALRNAAESTGGIYFPIDYASTITDIVSAISQDQTSEIKANPVVTKVDKPEVVVWVMVVFTLLAIFFYRRFSV